MVKYGAVICFIVLIVLVLSRVLMMKKLGMQAFVFAKTHRSDLLLPPVAVFFVYHLFANAFGLPMVQTPVLLNIPWLGSVGLMSCMLGIGMFAWGLVSFGTSFRVGIDDENPDSLITSGAFAVSRNPLYVAFAMELTGFFLIFPNVIMLLAMLGGYSMFHRQIMREEKFLKAHYGEEYELYCKKVRRYL